jgi:hypothetical protein
MMMIRQRYCRFITVDHILGTSEEQCRYKISPLGFGETVMGIVTLYFNVILCLEYFILFHSDNSIQFNSILYYLCAESTAVRPITDTAQCTYKYLRCGATQHRVIGKLQASTGENTC